MIHLALALLTATAVPDSLLARAGFNRPDWETALAELEDIERDRAIWLLKSLPELDLLEIDRPTLLAHVRGCSRGLGLRRDYAIPEDTLRAYVLYPVTGHYDMLTEWRTELFGILRERCSGDLTHDADMVVAFVEGTVAVEPRTDAFGPPSPPIGTLRRGWGSDSERASLVVAGLRSVGIGAHLAGGAKAVNAWDGQGWRPVFSGPDHRSGDSTGVTQTARLELCLVKDGQPWRSPEHVGLSRWEKGSWRPVEQPEYQIACTVTDSGLSITGPPGTYLLTAGVRNARGEPRVWCSEVVLDPERPLVVEQDLSIPFTELCREDLVESEPPDLLGVTLLDSSGAAAEVRRSLASGNPVLVCAVARGHERSERFLSAMEDHRPDLLSEGVQLFIVAPDTITSSSWVPDGNGLLWKALNVTSRDCLPAVVLYSAQGELLLFRRGAGPSVVDLGLSCLRALK